MQKNLDTLNIVLSGENTVTASGSLDAISNLTSGTGNINISGDGTLNIYDTGTTATSCISASKKLAITSGTFSLNCYNGLTGAESLDVSGGTFTFNTSGSYPVDIHAGTATFSGGTFTSSAETFIISGDGNGITFTGGTFNVGKISALNGNISIVGSNSATVTKNSTVTPTINAKDTISVSNGTMTIKNARVAVASSGSASGGFGLVSGTSGYNGHITVENSYVSINTGSYDTAMMVSNTSSASAITLGDGLYMNACNATFSQNYVEVGNYYTTIASAPNAGSATLVISNEQPSCSDIDVPNTGAGTTTSNPDTADLSWIYFLAGGSVLGLLAFRKFHRR